MSLETEGWEIVTGVVDVTKYRAAIEARYLAADYEQNPGDILEIAPGLIEDFLAGPAATLGKRYLGEFVIPTLGLLVRTMREKESHALPWHTDSYVFPAHWRMVNCWTLLSPKTLDDCRRLELIPGESKIAKDGNPSHPTKGWLESDHNEVAQAINERGTVVPDINAGDAIAFNESVLHRTKWGTRPRAALEIRMVANSEEVIAEYSRNGQTIINPFDR